MKLLDFWRSAGLGALVIVFTGGCSAYKPAPVTAKEPVNRPTPQDVQLETVKAAEPTKTTPSASEAAPGMVVHIDPATGEILPAPPATQEVPKAAAKSAGAPAPELYQVPSPTPGGGVMVDLKGQFLTPLIATVGADGKMTLEHKSMPLDAAEKK